jgi:serine/threonine protein kinase
LTIFTNRAVRDFVLVKEIGTGNASTVWYAFCKKTSAPLAIKTYKKRKLSPLNRCQVAREINIHAQLDHPNVIALVRLCTYAHLLWSIASSEVQRTHGRGTGSGMRVAAGQVGINAGSLQ